MADCEMTYCVESCSNQGTQQANCHLLLCLLTKLTKLISLREWKIKYFNMKAFQRMILLQKSYLYFLKIILSDHLNWSFVWGKPVWCLQDTLIVDTAVLEDKKILLKPDLFFWYEKFLKDQISPVKHKTKYR